MKFTLNKSILSALTVAEFRENAGTKMVGIGSKRRAVVRTILSEAMKQNRTIEGTARSLSRRANTSQGKDKRDWIRVVKTEYTDAKAKASLDLIRSVFGDDAFVYREPSPECCEKCAVALKGKKFKVSAVPEELIGALHPNCSCGPWKSVDKPDLTKSMDALADVPIGVVRRVAEKVGHYAEISTGTGYWVRMDSATGKSIIRVMLTHIPIVEIGKHKGFCVFHHGFLKADKEFKIYDLMKIGQARFYPASIMNFDDQEFKQESMTKHHDLAQYITKMQAALPTVALMPEYWDSGAKWKYLSDFMGYKTLTDWHVVVPGEVPLRSFIASISKREMSVKRAIRSFTRWSVGRDALKKAGQ